jgi:4-hydroxymandelate oxidase
VSGTDRPGVADLSRFVTLDDFEAAARGVMPHAAFEYVAGGAADEHTLRWNRDSFARIRLRPRVLADVAEPDLRVELLGATLPHPVLLAPAAYQRAWHPEGERAVARGAGATGTTYVVSTATTTPIAEVAREATAPLWFQLYVQSDRGVTEALVREVEAAGCRALCVTVDTPTLGIRDRMQRAGFELPPGIPTPHLHDVSTQQRGIITPDRVTVTWKDIAWLRSAATVPVLLKGILDADDAARAIDVGADGIIVSNHGARNLDTVPASLDALPGVVDRVAGRVPVLMDGGIRRGTDVVKALALGARAVLIGRPYCYALAVGGAAGVQRAVELLVSELGMALKLLGRPSVAAVDRTVLWDA